tara:strand:- start:329 stop:433 length:105 start_codon:yes stop_codon:yes gene_type:complete
MVLPEAFLGYMMRKFLDKGGLPNESLLEFNERYS